MKKLILFLVLAIILIGCISAQNVVYDSTPTLQWDDDGLLANGDPVLPEDTVVYEVYLWDTAQGDIKAQAIGDMEYFGTSSTTEIQLAFTNRYNWAVAIRSRVTQADSTVVYGNLAYTTSEIPETATGPFVYVPTLQDLSSGTTVSGLQDSGM